MTKSKTPAPADPRAGALRSTLVTTPASPPAPQPAPAQPADPDEKE